MRTNISIAVALCITVVACDGSPGAGAGGESGAAADTSSSSDTSGESDTSGGSTGGAATSATTEDGRGTNEGDTTTSDGSTSAGVTGSDGGTGEVDEIGLLNIESAASAINGDSLRIASYTVPADGVLVVRGGAAGTPVQSVTFGGEPLTAVASHDEPDYWFAISADMYWMPVTAGQSGEIAWDYQPGEWTTRRRAMIALTISGVDEVHALATTSDGLGTNEGRTGPTAAQLEITTTQEAVILSTFTSNGWGPSELTGLGHTLDAYPTIPLEAYHSTRVYGGHAQVGPGTVTLGFENTEDIGWFDYVLFVAAFTRSE